jgi:hypothetical protein
MRKKKVQRRNQRARERVLERRLAHSIARDFQHGDKWFLKAGKAAENSDEQLRAFEIARNHWFSTCTMICSLGAAKWLRLVADALEGKLHGAKDDEAIEEAVKKAVCDGERRHERDLIFFPFASELYDAFKQIVAERWQRTRKPSRVPHKDALIRRAKILGHGLSKKRGRPHKKRLPRL